MKKNNKHKKKIPVIGEKLDLEINKFRQEWLKKGYELVDITQLCEFRLGCSGWCNDFNDPDEKIYHIQVVYRRDQICSFPDPNANCDDKYVVFETNKDDFTGADFTIFRKVPMVGEL